MDKPSQPKNSTHQQPTHRTAAPHTHASNTAVPQLHAAETQLVLKTHTHQNKPNSVTPPPIPRLVTNMEKPAAANGSGTSISVPQLENVVNTQGVQEGFVGDEEMEDFPPLVSSAAHKTGVSIGSGKIGGLPEKSMTEMDKSSEGAENKRPVWGQHDSSGAVAGEQTGNLAGRSMADALRSGQPTEGPIFLDREKAEKRGEVRLVEGKPCLFFSANETSLLADRLGPAIVGKFSHSIPPAHQIQKALGKIKLVGSLSWNFLNAKHVFIQLTDMRDYVKLLNGPNNSPIWYIEHHPMRVFKWTPEFDPYFESPITTAWCNILALPVHLFEESSLIAIGEMLGKPVQVDRATIARSRVSFARICVEVDLSRPIVEEIDINIAGKQVTLKVKWEKIPLYCSECKHVGHSAITCYAAGKRPMPPKRDYTRGPIPSQNRTPLNREGEARHNFTQQEQQPTSRPSETRGQHQGVRKEVSGNKGSERLGSEGGQTARQEDGVQKRTAGERTTRPGFHQGSTSTATEGTQAVEDDGFAVQVGRKSSKYAAARRRYRANRRARIQTRGMASKGVTDAEGESAIDMDRSSGESEREARSLSPSRRSGNGVGPLAMVLHGNNMFGALEGEPSDEDVDSEDQKDYRMEPADTRVLQSVRTGGERCEQNLSLSPPSRGTPKRARLSALRTQ